MYASVIRPRSDSAHAAPARARTTISAGTLYKLTHDARRKLKAGLLARGFLVAEILDAFSAERYDPRRSWHLANVDGQPIRAGPIERVAVQHRHTEDDELDCDAFLAAGESLIAAATRGDDVRPYSPILLCTSTTVRTARVVRGGRRPG
jgi:hypothetical protein